MRPHSLSETSGGFTLIEMMLVIAVLGILTVIAAPAFNSQIEYQRAKSASIDIYIALMRARSEAIKRNLNMTVSPKGGNWSNGWQILDPVTNQVIEDHDSLRGIGVAGPASVTYQTSGRLQSAAAPTFGVTGSYASSARCVSIDLSGRPNIKAGTC